MSYEDTRNRLESGGKADAYNPASGAAGKHQFLASTWNGLVQRYKPAWAEGKTPAEILKARYDPNISDQMVKLFDAENQKALRVAGIPVNDTTMYLSHHFGQSGARTIFNAPDNTPMKDLVTPLAYAKNAHLHGKTKGQMLADFAKRSAGAVGSTASAAYAGPAPVFAGNGQGGAAAPPSATPQASPYSPFALPQPPTMDPVAAMAYSPQAPKDVESVLGIGGSAFDDSLAQLNKTYSF